MPIEAGLRGAALALLALLVTLGLREWRSGAPARYGALFSLSAAAYAVESAPFPALQHAAWMIPVRLVSIGTPAVFWLWARAHFDDDFTPSWRGWAAWGGLVALGAAAIAIDREFAWHVVQAGTLVFAGLGMWQVLSGRSLDLVENRRRARLVLAIGVALYIAIINLCFLVPLWLGATWPGTLVSAAGLAAMTFGFALLSLMRADAPAPSPAAVAPPAADGIPTAQPPPDTQEMRWLAALRQAMEIDKAYREEGFGVAALAARLGIPEYRLRRLINQRLGHRNFTTFVNDYRLTETMAALADPTQAEVPILTIALDAGFQSLGPFNRAFKARTGLTPSEYRRQYAVERRPAAE